MKTRRAKRILRTWISAIENPWVGVWKYALYVRNLSSREVGATEEPNIGGKFIQSSWTDLEEFPY